MEGNFRADSLLNSSLYFPAMLALLACRYFSVVKYVYNSHARALFVVRLRDIIILHSLAFILYFCLLYIIVFVLHSVQYKYCNNNNNNNTIRRRIALLPLNKYQVSLHPVAINHRAFAKRALH